MDWMKVSLIVLANVLVVGWAEYQRRRDKKIIHHK